MYKNVYLLVHTLFILVYFLFYTLFILVLADSIVKKPQFIFLRKHGNENSSLPKIENRTHNCQLQLDAVPPMGKNSSY